MKKTAEEILNEYQSIEIEGINLVAYGLCLKAMQEYASQFHPTPTEAEINEAAINTCPDTLANWSQETMFEVGFQEGVQWLQNYQTQGREKPEAEFNKSIKVNSFHVVCPSCNEPLDVIPADGTFIHKSEASQPNPAIAVIEALEAARAELYQFVPITHVSILHKLTDAINSIKQIKP